MSPHPPARASDAPLDERDIDRLQALLDALPPPLEPLDVSMLDGYLCGVLLQPQAVPAERWLPHVADVDARALPAGVDVQPLRALVLRRHAELAAAIERREWFDPWVFELEADPAAAEAGAEDNERDGDERDADARAAGEAVYPWVAGFATAMEIFPGLMALHAAAMLEPLALLYRHFAPDDLEDADELLAVIVSLEPPADLAQAVEELVRATLLLADVSRPQAAARRTPRRGPARGRPPGARSGHR